MKEVAELLQVNSETVRRWIRHKKLGAQKMSNKGGNKILESELLAFLKASPGYAESLFSLLVGSVAASAVMLATYATGKAVETNEKKAKVDSDAIQDYIRSKIASHKALVKQKMETSVRSRRRLLRSKAE